MSRRATLLLIVLLSPSAGAPGQPLAREQVPMPLRPWVEWALHGREEELCPFLHDLEGEHRCAWPGPLTLELGQTQGQFSQTWSLDVDGFIPLPGDARRWPQDVTVDGRPATALLREGRPVVLLGSGTHRVSGSLLWDGLPDALPVSPDVGLVDLSVEGAAVAFPRRDGRGRLLLRQAASDEVEGDRLEVTVHRRLIDEVPVRLLTRLELSVSGRGREVLLSRALLPGFVPMALEGSLPARLDSDGRLAVQVRPGRWTLTLSARSEGPVGRVGPSEPEGPWAAEEVWVFDARPDLRMVDVEGVPAVDPRQTTLPDAWKQLPAYRLVPGDALILTERRRGDQDPPPDRLRLHRVLWLDFDGDGLSVLDLMTGVMRRSWRLEMAPPSTLERVVVGGVDQVLTRRQGSESVGLEVRQGSLRLAAESRLEGHPFHFAAVGWEHDFQQLSADLHLPPGWRLLAALGVDGASETWIGHWNLLDFFVVLILALAFQRLWGWTWGVLALSGLVLIYHEPGAPVWTLFPVLAAEGLLRYLPEEGRARRLFRGISWTAVGLLVVMSVPFLVQQVRQGMYPILEHPWARLGDEGGVWQDVTQLASEGKLDLEAGYQETSALLGAAQRMAVDLAPASPAEPEPTAELAQVPVQKLVESKKGLKVGQLNLQDLDPQAVVNTGAGLPRWQWNRVRLSWNGPVGKAQSLHLIFLSPLAGFVLMVVRVLLLCMLVLRALGVAGRILPRPLRSTGAAVGILLLAAAVTVPAPVRAQTPEPELLAELQRRLLERPACYPRCAELPRLALEYTAGFLRGGLEVGALAATAVPLPGGFPHWLPNRVLVDGEPARVAGGAEGILWVPVEPGRHRIVFEGPLPDREVVQLSLPLPPHRVEVRGTAWTLEGLGADGTPDASLRLVRARPGPRADATALEAQRLPSFLEVERTLILGLHWQVATQVRRLSPPGVPVLAEIPLLDGESVTTEEVRMREGKVLVNLASTQQEVSWVSDLEVRERVRLAAPKTLEWVEIWHLDASPIWHVETVGIPPVHPEEEADVRLPEWRPWPNESLELRVSRPAGIDGRSLTIDRSALTVVPGSHSLEARLELDLRSSLGGRHSLQLPEGAELETFSVDGRLQPIRQDGGRVTIPVAPGSQAVTLSWREARGISAGFRAPRVDLGLPSVNALTRVEPPAGRWILFTWGPRAGPAVLFWSLLLVVVLVAAGLGRIPLTPLGTVQWALLGVGLTQLPLPAVVTVAGWLLALGLRRQKGQGIRRNLTFDLLQVLLVILTFAALLWLIWGVQKGLLGQPEMQITGNGSHAGELRWTSDRIRGTLPAVRVFSIPMLVYRFAMLAWALWLATALLGWLHWGWECFAHGGSWRRLRKKEKRADDTPSVGGPGTTAAG